MKREVGQEYLFTILLLWAQNDCVEKIKEAEKKYPLARELMSVRFSTIVYAAVTNDNKTSKVLEYLLTRYPTDGNIEFNHKNNLLHIAAINNNSAALDYLAKNHSYLLNKANCYGQTPYLFALRNKKVNKSTIEYLHDVYNECKLNPNEGTISKGYTLERPRSAVLIPLQFTKKNSPHSSGSIKQIAPKNTVERFSKQKNSAEEKAKRRERIRTSPS